MNTTFASFKTVIGDFLIERADLESLEGRCPDKVTGRFDCSYNKLKSLKGCPQIVWRAFNCERNILESLEGCPKELQHFDCSHNKLKSLKGGPKIVDGRYDCAHNRLQSLKDIHKHIQKISGAFYCDGNPIESHVLGLLLIDGYPLISHEAKWAHILNRHNTKMMTLSDKDRKKQLLKCQKELIENGFERYAQL